MDTNRHIIKEQIFDVVFDQQEKATALQNRISDLFYNEAMDITTDIFDRLVPADAVLQLDTLVIDLGVLPLAGLESAFGSAYREQLENEIARRLPDVSLPASSSVKDDTSYKGNRSAAALLAYFLLHGYLPWWAGDNRYPDPFLIMEKMAGEEKEQLKTLLVQLGASEAARRRLAWQFPEKILQSVIEILEPAEAAFILGYHRGITRAQQEKPLVQSEAKAFARSTWFFILTYLLHDRGSRFNRKEFVSSTIRQMAAYFNISYGALLALLYRTLEAEKDHLFLNDSELPAVITELFGDIDTGAKIQDTGKWQDAVLPDEPGTEWFQSFELIRYYFSFGSLPAWSKVQDDQQLVSLLIKYLDVSPSSLRALLLAAPDKQGLFQRIIQLRNEGLVHRLVLLLAPEDTRHFAACYITKMEWLQQERRLFRTDAAGLVRTLRENMLLYFIYNRHSSVPVFLEAGLRQLAVHFNIPYRRLLSFMLQGLGEEPGDEEAIIVFEQVKQLLYEQAKTAIPAMGVSLIADDPGAGRHIPSARRRIRDILGYLLLYDRYPWWISADAERSPAALWKQLLAISPGDIVLLLQRAGMEQQNRQRVIHWLPDELLKDSFRLLAAGKDAVPLYESFYMLFEQNPFFRIRDKRILHALLLSAFWAELAERNYAGLDVAGLVERGIYILSRWTGISGSMIADQLNRPVKTGRVSGIPVRLVAGISAAGEKMGSRSLTAGYDLPGEEAYLPGIQLLISHYFSPGETKTADELAGASVELLLYYLQHNRLPERIEKAGSFFADRFLKGLLEWLFYKKPAELGSILADTGHHPAARIRLHAVFISDMSAANAALRKVVAAYHEEDAARYAMHISGQPAVDGAVDIRRIMGFILSVPDREKKDTMLRRLFHSHTIAGYAAGAYDDETVWGWVGAMHSRWHFAPAPFLKAIQQLFIPVLSDSLEQDRFGVLFRQFILFHLIGQDSKTSPEDFLLSFVRYIAVQDVIKSPGIYVRLSAGMSKLTLQEAPLIYPYIPVLRAVTGMLISRDEKATALQKTMRVYDRRFLRTGYDNTARAELLKAVVPEKQQHSRPAENQPERNEKAATAMNEEEAVYIKNAGLVLVHPLLPALFTKLQWTEKGQFINEAYRYRAVHLLQYLVTGREDAPEYELPLNKILCGLPAGAPVPAIKELDAKEKQLGEELLQVLLRNWNKLQHTSAEGLRVSFLQRNGILFYSGGNWKLRVEQKGIDVLLSFLPWGIGMIKTPWMKKIVFTEWT